MTGSRTVEESIPPALDGQRIDRVVALVTDLSRRDAVRLIEDGRVLVDGARPDKPSLRVAVDSTILIEIPDVEKRLEPDPSIEYRMVHVDDQVIVVDKPAGLVVHPGSGIEQGTLVNGLLSRFPELASVGQPDRPGVVHRLDRGTSGLLMVARTEHAHESLVDQLAARTVARRYVALVHGVVESDAGVVDAPLGRSPRDRTKQAVVVDGRPARTHYEVDRRWPNLALTLVGCRLETGRTHQIRVHLAAIGHPVVGDDRYGEADPVLDRPFLHAVHLGFTHPSTGDELTFDADLPADLEAELSRLPAE